MDISTFNTIVGVSATLIGSGILFALGSIITYVRSINRKMEGVLMANVRYETIIGNHSEQLKDIWIDLNGIKENHYRSSNNPNVQHSFHNIKPTHLDT